MSYIPLSARESFEKGKAIRNKEARQFLRMFQKKRLLPNGGKSSASKRLSSEEFLRIHEELWKEGPKVRYLNPDAWVKPESS